MSTDWTLYCRSCADAGPWDQGREDSLLELWRHRGVIVELSKAMDSVYRVGPMDFSITFWGSSSPTETLAWIVQHADHFVVPRDEYGRFSDQCPKQTECPCCDTRFSCDAGVGHEGPCSNKRVTP